MHSFRVPGFQEVQASVIGRDAVVGGPFGPRQLVYADHTASGRAVALVEAHLLREVLPLYANTHSEGTATSRSTSAAREAARQLIQRELGGGAEDVVVFCGSGSTAAIDKLTHVLGLRLPRELDERYGLAERIPEHERPVVFIGPYEHHSNELCWRESIATLVRIPEASRGGVDLGALEHALSRYAERPLKIGSFSAASNVTGIITDVDAVSRVLHRSGALACWDYATAGCYLPISMAAPPGDPLAYKDAIFLSPHKLLGGPGAAGVLIAKRRLFQNRVPTVPGGGTITYVNARVQHYAADIATREEGGTPDILGSIRAGLAFEIKRELADELQQRSAAFTERALATWSCHPSLVILGVPGAKRVPIVSLLVRHAGRYLHHHFVTALLSDLFGIQARGGCSCAGPYGHALLGIDADTERGIEEQVLCGRLGIKPGWVRLSFHGSLEVAEVGYVIEAVRFVADHGARFLPLYDFDLETGAFIHRGGRGASEPSAVSLASGAERPSSASLGARLERQLLEARALLAALPLTRRRAGTLPQACEAWRWFALEADAELRPLGRRPLLEPTVAFPSVAPASGVHLTSRLRAADG